MKIIESNPAPFAFLAGVLAPLVLIGYDLYTGSPYWWFYVPVIPIGIVATAVMAKRERGVVGVEVMEGVYNLAVCAFVLALAVGAIVYLVTGGLR